jgi:hypothetical protein
MAAECMVTNHVAKPHTDLDSIFNALHHHNISSEILFFDPTQGNRNCARDAIINMAHDEAPATTGQTKNRPGEAGDQFQLQFVTTVSVNVPSNAEKKRNQKIIRQTVMKNFRQQQRTEKSKPKGKKRLAATSNSDPDAEEPDTDEPSSGASQFTSRSQSSSLSERGGKKGVEDSEHRRSSRISSQSPLDLGSPITPLGAGRIDPFKSAYADNNHVLHELIDHCKHISRKEKNNQIGGLTTMGIH